MNPHLHTVFDPAGERFELSAVAARRCIVVHGWTPNPPKADTRVMGEDIQPGVVMVDETSADREGSFDLPEEEAPEPSILRAEHDEVDDLGLDEEP